MKLLGLDFETQSADAKTTNATEVGAVLYEYEHHQLKPILTYNELIWDASYPPQTEKIVALTKISDAELKTIGIPPSMAFTTIMNLISRADVIVCHKISFDRTVYLSTCKRLGFTNIPPGREWLCTLTNFPWPKTLTCHKLSHLAYEHGILVDPRTLHRAAADVELMMRVINECYDLDEVLAYARLPWIYVKADVVGPWVDGGKQNGKAKELGFSYEQVKGVDEHKWPKTWVCRVKKESEFAALKEAGRSFEPPFRVARIEGLN